MSLLFLYSRKVGTLQLDFSFFYMGEGRERERGKEEEESGGRKLDKKERRRGKKTLLLYLFKVYVLNTFMYIWIAF